MRARTIAYSTERVKPAELSTYAALGDPRWKGKLCLRSGKAVYNQSLVAMMIGDIGEEATEKRRPRPGSRTWPPSLFRTTR